MTLSTKSNKSSLNNRCYIRFGGKSWRNLTLIIFYWIKPNNKHKLRYGVYETCIYRSLNPKPKRNMN